MTTFNPATQHVEVHLDLDSLSADGERRSEVRCSVEEVLFLLAISRTFAEFRRNWVLHGKTPETGGRTPSETAAITRSMAAKGAL